jgi:hypothetical protein
VQGNGRREGPSRGEERAGGEEEGDGRAAPRRGRSGRVLCSHFFPCACLWSQVFGGDD